ncbi:MAG: aminoacyl-tRNA hydrolase [Pseudomonadota bacterium]
MKLFVGLGNPGSKYAGNRHNVGFMALGQIGADHGVLNWKSKFQGEIANVTLDGEKVLLLKPNTFMNLSGQSVGEAMRFHKINPKDVYVFHDELDLKPGKMRVKFGGGHAGHNGLRSIHQHIGADYHRIRIGIGHPGHKDKVAGYVLQDFAKSEMDWVEDIVAGIGRACPFLATGEHDKFMTYATLQTPSPKGRSSMFEPKPSAKPLKSPEQEPDTRSALQKLVDKFK